LIGRREFCEALFTLPAGSAFAKDRHRETIYQLEYPPVVSLHDPRRLLHLNLRSVARSRCIDHNRCGGTGSMPSFNGCRIFQWKQDLERIEQSAGRESGSHRSETFLQHFQPLRHPQPYVCGLCSLSYPNITQSCQ
jgi:hypothetical protein